MLGAGGGSACRAGPTVASVAGSVVSVMVARWRDPDTFRLRGPPTSPLRTSRLHLKMDDTFDVSSLGVRRRHGAMTRCEYSTQREVNCSQLYFSKDIDKISRGKYPRDHLIRITSKIATKSFIVPSA